MVHGLRCSTACGIVPDQGSNPCPLHWQADSQPLRHQGSPLLCFMVHNSRALTEYFKYPATSKLKKFYFIFQENFILFYFIFHALPPLPPHLLDQALHFSGGERKSGILIANIKPIVSSTPGVGNLWLLFQSRTQNIICAPDIHSPVRLFD